MYDVLFNQTKKSLNRSHTLIFTVQICKNCLFLMADIPALFLLYIWQDIQTLSDASKEIYLCVNKEKTISCIY